MEQRYTVTQAADILGVRASVLRYWEEELELRICRNEQGHRYYTGNDITLRKKLKDKEKYVAESGKLILFLAAGSFVMAILMYFSVHAAVVEIAVWFVVFGILWKRMNDKYGTPNSHKKK